MVPRLPGGDFSSSTSLLHRSCQEQQSAQGPAVTTLGIQEGFPDIRLIPDIPHIPDIPQVSLTTTLQAIQSHGQSFRQSNSASGGFLLSEVSRVIYPTCVTSSINLGIVSVQTDCSSLLNYLLTFLAPFPLPPAYEKPQNTEVAGFFHLRLHFNFHLRCNSKIAHFLQ